MIGLSISKFSIFITLKLICTNTIILFLSFFNIEIEDEDEDEEANDYNEGFFLKLLDKKDENVLKKKTERGNCV